MTYNVLMGVVKPYSLTHSLYNNNNNHDDIFSAVIMTEVIGRVHSVHLVNVEQRIECIVQM